MNPTTVVVDLVPKTATVEVNQVATMEIIQQGPQGVQGPPGASTQAYGYNLSTSNTSPPGMGNLSTNATGPVASTLLYIDPNAAIGNISPLLPNILANDSITVQDENDSTKYVTWLVTGNAINRGGYFEVPISHKVSSGGYGKNNQRVLFFHFRSVAYWRQWTGTQAAYDAISVKDTSTLYVIV